MRIALLFAEGLMKKAVIGLLLVSGFAMAATKVHSVPPPQAHLSSWERMALNTQSPRVRVSRHGTVRPGYRVAKSKGAISAFVPFGK
jgi:hypothetical protein